MVGGVKIMLEGRIARDLVEEYMEMWIMKYENDGLIITFP